MTVIDARLEFVQTERGGRHSYAASGYRATLDFGGVRVDGGFEFRGKDRVRPGEDCVARILIPDPARLLGAVERGSRFEVLEGDKRVALGEVLERAPDPGTACL